MIEPSDFFVTLQSDQEKHNSCLSFNVKLPRTVYLYSEWKIAITQISSTASFEKLEYLPTFVITSNIVEESIYNNEVLKSLKVISFDEHWENTGIYINKCENREYHRIHTKHFQELNIDFVDVNPTGLELKGGITYITLHFYRQ